MWTVNAEEGMRCNECLHEIAEGSICLSQIPPVVPEGFHRRNYQNFCIACEGCNSNVEELREDTPPCFALWLDHWYTSREQAPATVDCGYCGAAINRGTITVAQEFFDWPPPEVDLNSERGGASASGSPAGVAIAGTGIPRPAGGWENLSRATQRRFKVGGLGRDLGSRSEAMAQRLYDSVPKEVRNLGEEAVKRFLKGKDASHIRSVSNAPGRARQPGNVVWEKSSLNRARGGRNMIPTEVAKAKSAGRLSGLSTVGRSMASNAAKGGAIAALTEAPVSGVENFLHWKRGRKSGQQAVKDAAKDVTLAGAVGATTAGVMTGACAMGVGLSLGPFGVPLMIAGGTILVGNGILRIAKAAQLDLPLDEYLVFFCKDSDCKLLYAQTVTDAGMRPDSQNGRITPVAIALALGAFGATVVGVAAGLLAIFGS